MPEGVEVRRFVDLIAKHVTNTKNILITGIEILGGRYKTHKPFEGYTMLEENLPIKVESVNSKGKLIYMTFSNQQHETYYAISTLGLSGGWTFKRANHDTYEHPNVREFGGEKVLDHLNTKFTIGDTLGDSLGDLYFYDSLSFGTFKVFKDCAILDKKLKELGADILDDSTTLEIFKQYINKRVNSHKAIGNVIVNQKIISGVGNYLRADALWLAKISPFRKVASLNDIDIKDIFNALKCLVLGDYDINKANKLGFNMYSLPGHYKRDYFVYKENVDIYGNLVKKEELFEGSQKRFIYWCPDIQN